MRISSLVVRCKDMAERTTKRVKRRVAEVDRKIEKVMREGEKEERKVDPNIDPFTHDHTWTYKWSYTYRECFCGIKQWRLACWTGHNWQTGANNGVLDVRKDLNAEKLNDGPNRLYTTKPHLIRSWDLIPEEKLMSTQVTVIGAGSIGSFTTLALSKMGVERLTVFDPQRIGMENIGVQLYGHSEASKRDDNGQPPEKVNALARILQYIGPTGRQGFIANPIPYTSDIALTGIVIAAVDSMVARQVIWKGVKNRKEVEYLIDARMGAEFALMYTINPNDPKDITTYEKTLYSDEDAKQEPCTARATVYTAFLIAGMICKAVKDIMVKKPYPRIMQWNIADHYQDIQLGGENEEEQRKAAKA